MFALLPKDQTFQNLLIFTAADIKFRVTAIKCFPLSHHTVTLLCFFPGSLRPLNLFSIFLKTNYALTMLGGEGLLVLHFSLVVINRLKFIEYAVRFFRVSLASKEP